MSRYCKIEDVKEELRIDSNDSTFNREISRCITKASSWVDGELERNDLTVPSSTPQKIKDATVFRAAHIFRRRRDPSPGEATGTSKGLKDTSEQTIKEYVESIRDRLLRA